MAAIANVVLSDATPVAHTFVPKEASPQRSRWTEDAAADQMFLRPSLVALHRDAKAKGEVARSELRLSFPLYTVDGDGLIINRGTSRIIIQFIKPSEMTATEKADQLAMARDLIDEQLAQDYMDDNPAY